MKNENKNRYIKLLERIEQNTKFKLELRKIRGLYEIPLEDGFVDDTEYRKWEQKCIDKKEYNKFLTNDSPKLFELALILVLKNMPLMKMDQNNLKGSFFLYISRGKKAMRHEPQMTFQLINSLDKSYTDFLKRNYKDGIIIAIPPNATNPEVKDYIDYRLQNRQIFFGDNPKPFRIRKYSQSDKHETILRVWRQHKDKRIKELRRISGNNSAYDKYDAISTLLNKEYDIKIKSSGLRTMIDRIKRRKGN